MGGSMGGMQVLKWATAHPDRVFAAVPIATASRHSPRTSRSTRSRPGDHGRSGWCGGSYFLEDSAGAGLAVARMAAHITYLSEVALHRKFGRNLQDRKAISYGLMRISRSRAISGIRGASFVERFDANSYLYITAHRLFRSGAEHGGRLARRSAARWCAIA